MSCFAVMRSPRAEINDTPIVDGQFFIETDQTVNNLYNDNGNTRISLGRYDWTVLVNKPFNTIGDRLSVNNGVLSADIQSWNIIDNKPFENIGNGLTVTNHILSADDVAWNIVQDKPFETVGDRLTITDNVLSADIQSWNIVNHKPFETIDVNTLTIENDTVIANYQTWSEILTKPFETIDSNTLTVNNNIITANYQTWSQILSKPFTSLGIGLNVKPDGTLYATGGVIGGLDWSTKVINKPFETLGSTLTKNSDNELSIGVVNWSNIGVKPFNTVGTGLQVTDNALTLDTVYWTTTNNKPFNTVGTGLNINADELVLGVVTWNNTNYKPFNTIGSGLSVNSNDEILTDLQTVNLSQVGTASDINFSRQELSTNNGSSPIEITGTKYMEISNSLDPSQAVIFDFQNQDITIDSGIDVMTLLNNNDNTRTLTCKIIPSNVSVINGQCVVTYPASDLGSITCRIYIL